ncbi:MAG: metal ABC transporter ATP-binding protein [Sodalinema sp.]|uniref:metal ABC transporter ATP-binding protein n=1 Tax=Sodalinema sp. TaxID=3080550 RepID=UPI001203E435|nr:MAG: metal ABC transporter ATP-binding protein [Phormidium sp. SL48-SHIP]
MSDTVLTVENLTVYRETYAAVQNVSFSLETGTDTAIVGPNGAGKSTLVQALLGILPRQSGDIFVLGQALSRQGSLPSAVREKLAYLPQQFLFDRRIPITVEELVGLGWDPPGLRFPWLGGRQRFHQVRQALARVDAAHLRSQPISRLSGGEMKRVLLAYCLVRPRSLLILDEAPAGLDIQSESEFYQLLYQLKQEQGWAILQVSHDLDMVRRHCDRVLCLNRTLRCQGVPDVALSPENLVAAYGNERSPYHHSHS